MTTLTYKHGMLAVDSRATHSGVITSPYKKLHTFPGFALGIAGCLPLSMHIVSGILPYAKGLKRGILPKITLDYSAFEDNLVCDVGIILLTKTGAYSFGSNLIVDDITDRPFALGTGSVMAYTAMHMDCNAVEAVEIACDLDPYSGRPIYSVTQEDL